MLKSCKFKFKCKFLLNIIFLTLITLPCSLVAREKKLDELQIPSETERKLEELHNVKESEKLFNLLKQVIKTVKQEAIVKKTDRELISLAIKGVLNKLDEHSSYFTGNQLTEIKALTKGEFEGIGIIINQINNGYQIVGIIEDSPAHRAELELGDIIVEIEKQPILKNDLLTIVQKIKGKAGSKLRLGIERGGKKQEFTVVRDTIKINPVSITSNNGIIYIKLSAFAEGTAETIRENLPLTIKNTNKNFKGIILDLRDNPGGLLEEGIAVADLFLSNVEIVSIKRRDEDKSTKYYSSNNPIVNFKVPIVVLINERSASASEIVAGALQDNKRAVLVGAKTFGKGSIQIIIPLALNMGAIKFTNACYYTPSGKIIAQNGIKPDIEIKGNIKNNFTDEKASVTTDKQREKAMEVLNQLNNSNNF